MAYRPPTVAELTGATLRELLQHAPHPQVSTRHLLWRMIDFASRLWMIQRRRVP